MHNETIIHLTTIDGDEHVFSTPTRKVYGPDDTLGNKLERFLNQTGFAFSVDGELVVIPMHQVKSFRIAPIRHKLPDSVVTNVTRIRTGDAFARTA